MRLKQILAIVVAVAVLLTFAAVLHPVSTPVDAGQSAVPSGFDFPYTYQQPSVPGNIGAQGIQGPTVPLSAIGITGQAGASGHVGPTYLSNPYYIHASPANLNVAVRLGTPSAYSVASGITVVLTNVTDGRTYSAQTDTAGTVSLSVTSGWFLMTIAPPSSYIGFEQQMFVGGSSAVTRYLLPSSGATVPVNNGGSGAIYFSEAINAGMNFRPPQLYVSILNAASGNALLSSGYTGNNGSVVFTGLNQGSYAFAVDGYSNQVTGVRQYLTNYTTSPYSLGAGQILSISDSSVAGMTRTTGSLSGTALPTGSHPWDVSKPTTVAGGTTYVSSRLQFSNSATLTFSNAIVFFNESWPVTGTPGGITFTNSVVYFLSGAQFEFQASGYQPNIRSSDSIIFADMVRPGDSIVLGFTNSSNTLFYNARTNAPGAIYGIFYNDVILNSTGFGISAGDGSGSGLSSGMFDPHTDMSYVSIINSRITGGNTHIGNVNLTRVSMSNSSTALAALRLNANYFLLNETVPPQGAQFNVHFMNMTHSELTFTTPQNMSYIQYANSLPSNNYGNPPGAGPIAGFSVLGGGSGMGFSFINFSYTYLTWGFPMVNISPTFGGFDTFTNFYNCYFNYNDTQAQLSQVIASYKNDVGGIQPSPGETKPFYGNRINLVFHGPVGMNYSYVNFGDRSFMNPWSHTSLNSQNIGWPSYWTHDYFPYKAVMQDTYSYFRFFPSNPPGSVIISNSTFGYIFWNWSANLVGNNQEGFADIWMETATNEVFTPQAYINITYDTFDAPSFSAGPNGMAGNVQFAKSHVIGTVAFCKFLNSPDYVLYPPGVSNDYSNWYLPPHQDNILATASTVTVHDNYFLNLTNLTMPIGTDQAYQNGGNGGDLTEFNNHFFYYPLPGMQSINSSWAYGPGGYYGEKVPAYVGIDGYNGSNLAYEIPMGLGTTMTIRNGGAFVFNTTVGQASPSSYVTNPQGYTGSPSQYSWAIEPNFVWNGSAYVAQFNGMGGPQPDLMFNGYRYQWSFEWNMTYISTTAVSASPIPMHWFVPNPRHLAGTVNLYLHNYTSGQNKLLFTLPQAASGTDVSYTYRPWVDGLSAVYFINGTNINIVPPPPVYYTVSFTETGLPYGTDWNVTLGSQRQSSTGSTISFSVQNGSYPFSIDRVYGWMPSMSSGNVTVNGSARQVAVSFSEHTYLVTFNSEGLSGQTWMVTVNQSEQQSSYSSVSFNLPNGTYNFTIHSPSGFSANITYGSFTVAGGPKEILVSFTAAQPPKPSGPPVLFYLGSMPIHLTDLVAIVLAACLVVLLVVVLWTRQRGRSG